MGDNERLQQIWHLTRSGGNPDEILSKIGIFAYEAIRCPEPYCLHHPDDHVDGDSFCKACRDRDNTDVRYAHSYEGAMSASRGEKPE